jgi:hypothetical protein
LKKKAVAGELGGQPREASWILALPLSKTSPDAYSTYRNAISSLALFIFTSVNCALCIGFLDDDDRLHGGTLPYIILVVDVLLFMTRCFMRS